MTHVSIHVLQLVRLQGISAWNGTNFEDGTGFEIDAVRLAVKIHCCSISENAVVYIEAQE